MMCESCNNKINNKIDYYQCTECDTYYCMNCRNELFNCEVCLTRLRC